LVHLVRKVRQVQLVPLVLRVQLVELLALLEHLEPVELQVYLVLAELLVPQACKGLPALREKLEELPERLAHQVLPELPVSKERLEPEVLRVPLVLPGPQASQV
jgi:hypothetical protein